MRSGAGGYVCGEESVILNSDRIEQRFGSYGIEVLASEAGLRRSNLFSYEGDTAICRTYAVVQFAEPLDDAGRDEYVRQTAVVARALGVPAPPESVRALRDQLRMMRPELAGTPAAREAARYLIVRPPMPLAVRPVYGVLAAAAVALLPRWARRPLRLPYLPVAEAVVVRPAGDLLTRSLRWALSATPAGAPD